MMNEVTGFQYKRLFLPLFLSLTMGVLANRYGLQRYVLVFFVTTLILPYLAGAMSLAFLEERVHRRLHRPPLFLLLIFGLFFLIGYQSYESYVEKDPLAPFSDGQAISLEGYVKSVREGSFATDYEVHSSYLHIKGQALSLKEKQTLRIYGSDHGYRPGDQIRIKDPEIEKVYCRDEGISSYELYLKSRGIHNRLQVSSDQVELYSREGLYHRGFIHKNRHRTISFLETSLQKPQSQLLKSVLFGNQNYLDEDLREAFARTGTAHIIAVSGLHVGILVVIFTFLFRVLGIGKRLYLWLILGIIFFYGYLINFPISMVRAGMMYGLYVVAFYQQRPYDGIHALAVVGIISLLINPLALFTISFQLSFTATGSILVLYPKLEKILSFLPEFLRKLVAVTLAAQLGTFPLMAYYFGRISVISILANLLLMPTIAMLLVLGIIGICIGMVLEPLGVVINYFANGLLSYQIALVRLLQRIPGAYIEVEHFQFAWVIGYYVIIGSILLYREKRVRGHEMERIQKTSATG